jgi:hypothetical protein
MGIHRDLAIAAMTAIEPPSGFDRNEFAPVDDLPRPVVPGALPAMGRAFVPAAVFKLPVDVLMFWGLGDFGADDVCSTLYDPDSGWHNVLFGAYAIRSKEADGSAWGYGADGAPDFGQLFQIFSVDYDVLTAGQFGCPPQEMCFRVDQCTTGTETAPGTSIVWDSADVFATVPSLLHDFRTTLRTPQSYMVYGVPDPRFLAGRQPFQPVAMQGRMYMRRVAPQVTLAWGTLCPVTDAGRTVLRTIIDALGRSYLTAGGP